MGDSGPCPRELSSIGKDIALFMQGLRFEPRTHHFLHLNMWALAIRLLEKEKKKIEWSFEKNSETF